MNVVTVSGLNVEICKLKKELRVQSWRREGKAGAMNEGARYWKPLF